MAQSDTGVFPKAADAGEEPFGVFMAGVELAQAAKKLGGDGNLARLAVFGLGNVDDEALAVNVTRLDGECFVEAQSALIDYGAKGTVAPVAEGAKEFGDFIAGEDVRQRIFALDVDLFPNVPVEAEMIAVERAQAANGLIEGRGGELAFVLKMDQEVEHALRGKRGKILIGVVPT